jgi:hypothetical protein
MQVRVVAVRPLADPRRPAPPLRVLADGVDEVGDDGVRRPV